MLHFILFTVGQLQDSNKPSFFSIAEVLFVLSTHSFDRSYRCFEPPSLPDKSSKKKQYPKIQIGRFLARRADVHCIYTVHDTQLWIIISGRRSLLFWSAGVGLSFCRSVNVRIWSGSHHALCICLGSVGLYVAVLADVSVARQRTPTATVASPSGDALSGLYQC